jgi:uncharacterized Ntn-hydrolase superfamily protein
MTFSITGRCASTGMLGLAVTSSSVCVASRCAWARAGVGAVASQNITDPSLGPRALDLMAEGLDAAAALRRIVETAPHIAYRQLALIDRAGRTAHHSGANTLGRHAVVEGRDCVAAGNLLVQPDVPAAMAAAFEQAAGEHLAERLIRGLEAGLAAGGEEGPVKSAGVLVVHELDWPLVELRQDWREEDVIPALRKAWQAYAPQIDDYVTRALDPSAAPSYGVPGDP